MKTKALIILSLACCYRSMKHGIKLGVGFGVSYYHRMMNVFNTPSSDKIIAMKHQMDFGTDFSFIGMYEYALTLLATTKEMKLSVTEALLTFTNI